MNIKPLLILLLTALPTFARLGETKAECEKRYGKPVRTTEKGSLLYQKGGLDIAITFSNDKAVKLAIGKTKEGAPEVDIALNPEEYQRPRLSATEREVLLKANAGNSTWGEGTEMDANMTFWKRADDKASASFIGPVLILKDTGHQAHLDAGKKKDEAKKLDGF